MNSFSSLERRRRRCLRQENNSNLQANFFVELDNKWLCLTGVALFWET
jgi:hypothetical protein